MKKLSLLLAVILALGGPVSTFASNDLSPELDLQVNTKVQRKVSREEEKQNVRYIMNHGNYVAVTYTLGKGSCASGASEGGGIGTPCPYTETYPKKGEKKKIHGWEYIKDQDKYLVLEKKDWEPMTNLWPERTIFSSLDAQVTKQTFTTKQFVHSFGTQRLAEHRSIDVDGTDYVVVLLAYATSTPVKQAN